MPLYLLLRPRVSSTVLHIWQKARQNVFYGFRFTVYDIALVFRYDKALDKISVLLFMEADCSGSYVSGVSGSPGECMAMTGTRALPSNPSHACIRGLDRH